MAIVAITGDIGAGKSTVAKLLAEKFSCPLLDADKITAELWQDENIKSIFAARWGCPSGEITKSEISRRIFSDTDEYKFCNSILHPAVMKKIHDEAVKIKNCVIEIPLLFEATAGQKPDFIEKIFYVAADFYTRARRCLEQRGWDVDELKRREKFLLPREKKISMSDEVIYNNGSIDELNFMSRSLLVEIRGFEPLTS